MGDIEEEVFFFVSDVVGDRIVGGFGRDRPPARTQFGRPSLHLCETWHGPWDGARGFRAAHPKLPALSGLFSRRRYASCISFVSSGSCSDSIRDFLCEAGAGALYFFTGASSAGYSITGSGAANRDGRCCRMLDESSSYCRGAGRCWSHVFVHRSRRRVM